MRSCLFVLVDVPPIRAEFGGALHDRVAEAVTQGSDGACEVVGVHGFAQAKLQCALLEVGSAHADEAHGPPIIFRPRAFEEASSSLEEVIGEFRPSRDGDGTRERLEGWKAQLEGDCAGSALLACEVGSDAFGLPAKDGAKAFAMGLVVVERGLAGD